MSRHSRSSAADTRKLAEDADRRAIAVRADVTSPQDRQGPG